MTDARPTTVLAGLAIGVLASVAAAYLPARRAASIGPAAAMGGVVPTGPGGASVFERLVPPLRRLPVRWRSVLRGVGRHPRRSLATIVGVVLAAILILSSWGMVDTVRVL